MLWAHLSTTPAVSGLFEPIGKCSENVLTHSTGTFPFLIQGAVPAWIVVLINFTVLFFFSQSSWTSFCMVYRSAVIPGPQSRICSSHFNGNEPKLLLEGGRLPWPFSPLPPQQPCCSSRTWTLLSWFSLLIWQKMIRVFIWFPAGLLSWKCYQRNWVNSESMSGERREKREENAAELPSVWKGAWAWNMKSIRACPSSLGPLSSLQRSVPGTQMCVQHSTIKHRFTRNLHSVW